MSCFWEERWIKDIGQIRGRHLLTRTSMMPYFKQTCSIKKRYPREFGWTLPSLTPIARLICFLCPDFRAPHADFSLYILKEHPRPRWSRILNISRTVHTQRNIFIYIYIYIFFFFHLRYEISNIIFIRGANPHPYCRTFFKYSRTLKWLNSVSNHTHLWLILLNFVTIFINSIIKSVLRT